MECLDMPLYHIYHISEKEENRLNEKHSRDKSRLI